MPRDRLPENGSDAVMWVFPVEVFPHVFHMLRSVVVSRYTVIPDIILTVSGRLAKDPIPMNSTSAVAR